MSDMEFELKRRFAELRAEDEANAPAFVAVRGRRGGAEPNRAVLRGRRWIAPAVFAAAAAVVAAVCVGTRSGNEHARRQTWLRDSSAMAIRWTMPTDGLLQSARRTLQTPALSASVLDAAATPIPGTPFKGN